MRTTPSRVLLADDEPRNLALLEAILEPLAVETRTAMNGREAVEVFEEAPDEVDLVLLDVMMPELDGFRALAEIRRKSAKGVRVPVVLVTAMVAREDRIRALDAGADDFLPKPLDPHEVRCRVRTLLALRRAQKDLNRLQAERGELLREVEGSVGELLRNLECAAACVSRSGEVALLATLERAAAAATALVAAIETFAQPSRPTSAFTD